MTAVRLFIATPLHDARMHEQFTVGLLTAWQTFGGCQWHACNGTSLARQRDSLTAQFLETDCTHLLWVDSDIGWRAGDAQSLLDTGKDFVAGCYSRKGPGGNIPALLTGRIEGDLHEAAHVATGFLLVSRAAIERMAEDAPRYVSAGKEFRSFFHQTVDEGTEDLAFCRRWREVGGQVWLHSGITLGHFDGNTCFMPDVKTLAREQVAQAAE